VFFIINSKVLGIYQKYSARQQDIFVLPYYNYIDWRNVLTQPKQTIVIISGNSSFNYLLQRYADRIGFPTMVIVPSESAKTICEIEPVAVIFPSVENLGGSQSLVAELTNCDIPIIVCSSAADQNRTHELGADYCLLHPLVYDHFSTVLETITSRRVQPADVGG
jgi:hypothetical protein